MVQLRYSAGDFAQQTKITTQTSISNLYPEVVSHHHIRENIRLVLRQKCRCSHQTHFLYENLYRPSHSRIEKVSSKGGIVCDLYLGGPRFEQLPGCQSCRLNVFSAFLQANSKVVPYIIPRPVPSISFVIIYACRSFDFACSQLMTSSSSSCPSPSSSSIGTTSLGGKWPPLFFEA
jgi:hypothetical protein